MMTSLLNRAVRLATLIRRPVSQSSVPEVGTSSDVRFSRSGHAGPAADLPLILCRDVDKRYRVGQSERTALSDVNLGIQPGEFVAIVGASGCGKTTLLNMIAGLLHPTSGDVLIRGVRPRLPDPDVGYMFARDALLPWRTARRNVELPLETTSLSRVERVARAEHMLSLVDLESAHDLYRLQLSQGMRQRVALARTLAPDPSILLMDEPFAALDAHTKLAVQSVFLQIWENGQGETGETKTVVFVTHDLEEATLLADRVIVMLPDPGRIAEEHLIGLPRPRAHQLAEMMFDDQFRATAHELFQSLKGSPKSSHRSAGP
jgi:NitT/TauT family transport system ATP-binding protein